MRFPFFCHLFLLLALAVVPASANMTSAEEAVILVLGDSLTAGYGLSENEAFPTQLEKHLRTAGYAVTVVNAGASGDTTAGGLARLEWSLADRPDIVIVELGGNDALRGLDPSHTRANLEKIVVRLKEAGCRVILAGMQAPRNLGHGYYTKFDQIYPELADQHQLLFYPFFLEGVATVADLNQPDGIHPNAAGVQRIVIGILPVVKTALEGLGVLRRGD